MSNQILETHFTDSGEGIETHCGAYLVSTVEVEAVLSYVHWVNDVM